MYNWPSEITGSQSRISCFFVFCYFFIVIWAYKSFGSAHNFLLFCQEIRLIFERHICSYETDINRYFMNSLLLQSNSVYF